MKSHTAVLIIGFMIGLFSNRLFWMMGRMISFGVVGVLILGCIGLLITSKESK